MNDTIYQDTAVNDPVLQADGLMDVIEQSAVTSLPELPAGFVDHIRKRDKRMAPYTYRRPQYLQYIEYS